MKQTDNMNGFQICLPAIPKIDFDLDIEQTTFKNMVSNSTLVALLEALEVVVVVQY